MYFNFVFMVKCEHDMQNEGRVLFSACWYLLRLAVACSVAAAKLTTSNSCNSSLLCLRPQGYSVSLGQTT